MKRSERAPRSYEFDTSNVDFSRPSGVITFVTGGYIDCREGSRLQIGPETITQAYQLVGE